MDILQNKFLDVKSAAGAEYIQIGKVVIASILVSISNTSAWATKTLTGLPTPRTYTPVTLRASSDGSYKTFYASNQESSFSLNNGDSAAQNSNYAGQFAYVAK